MLEVKTFSGVTLEGYNLTVSSLAATLAPLTLPDVDGRPVHLGSLWVECPAVVVFLRHWG